MAEKIKLVQGDTRPYLKVTLRDADGSLINVKDSTVVLKFRQAGEDVTLFTLTGSQPNGGADGVVVFNFFSGALNVEPGAYEGEIEIQFAPTDVQTVYDLLKFSVRAQFN